MNLSSKFVSERPQTRNLAYTLIEVMFAIVIVGMLTALATPSYVKARHNSRKNLCIENLRQLDVAVQQWAFENAVSLQSPYSFTNAALLKFLKGSQLPACPAGGAYGSGINVGDVPRCTITGHELRRF